MEDNFTILIVWYVVHLVREESGTNCILFLSCSSWFLTVLYSQISWMEKFLQKGTEITAPVPMALPGTTGMGGFDRPSARGNILRSDASAALNVGVLHLVPTLEVFPLLRDPNT